MCVSDLAVPGRLSDVVPSPQLTVTPVIVAELETVKETVTVVPVLAGVGGGGINGSGGGRAETRAGPPTGKGGGFHPGPVWGWGVGEGACHETQHRTSIQFFRVG